jgi:hypothetical protein
MHAQFAAALHAAKSIQDDANRITGHAEYHHKAPPPRNALNSAFQLADQIQVSAGALAALLDMISRRPDPTIDSPTADYITETMDKLFSQLYTLADHLARHMTYALPEPPRPVTIDLPWEGDPADKRE